MTAPGVNDISPATLLLVHTRPVRHYRKIANNTAVVDTHILLFYHAMNAWLGRRTVRLR